MPRNSWKSIVPVPSLSMSAIIFLISSFLGSKPSARMATFSSFASIDPATRCQPKTTTHNARSSGVTPRATTRPVPPRKRLHQLCRSYSTSTSYTPQAPSHTHGTRPSQASSTHKPKRRNRSTTSPRTRAVSVEQVEGLPNLLLLLLGQLELPSRLCRCACSCSSSCLHQDQQRAAKHVSVGDQTVVFPVSLPPSLPRHSRGHATHTARLTHGMRLPR